MAFCRFPASADQSLGTRQRSFFVERRRSGTAHRMRQNPVRLAFRMLWSEIGVDIRMEAGPLLRIALPIGVALFGISALFEGVAAYRFIGHQSVHSTIASKINSIWERIDRGYGSRGDVTVGSNGEIFWHSALLGPENSSRRLLNEERKLAQLEQANNENEVGRLLWLRLIFVGLLPLLMGAGILAVLGVSTLTRSPCPVPASRSGELSPSPRP